MWTRQKAGCVPVRKSVYNDGWDVLLVQSQVTPSRWLFPKGGVEADETAVDAAMRETCEEGGVIGQVGPKLGCWKCNRGSKPSIHNMWLLFVHVEHGPDCNEWTERHQRARRWYSFDGARAQLNLVPAHLRRPELVEILAAAERIVNSLDVMWAIPPSVPVLQLDGAKSKAERLEV